MRPRATLGAALTLGGFLLLAPPPFVLLPLGVLLLLSRLDRMVQWVVVGGALLLSVGWIAAPGPLTGQIIKGWIVAATGTFLIFSLPGRRRAFDAAVLAAASATAITAVWLTTFEVPFRALRWEALRAMWALSRGFAGTPPSVQSDLNAVFTALGTLLPAVIVLQGLGGLVLSWRWYHLLANTPAGIPPSPFREFRFSDHLVWLVVIGMAGTVAQVAGRLDPAAIWQAYLLVLGAGLYIVRGGAVVWSHLDGRRPLPAPVLLLAGLGVLFLAPFVAAGLLGIGLADTWLDFRRRPADASGE